MERVLTELLERAGRHASATVQLGLERVRGILAALGNPHHNMNFIHVAGTNGKGSVVAFLEAILSQAGYRVGAYTSPHLAVFNERIRVDGQNIPDAKLIPILQTVLAASQAIPATFFELTTAAAFCYFAQESLHTDLDWVLLETGLGGRLDATNVITPKLSLVTSLSVDHTDYLGNTIEKIAREKAGIFKSGIPAAAAPMNAIAAEVLRKQALVVGTPLQMHGEDFSSDTRANSAIPPSAWCYHDAEGSLVLPRPELKGDHQIQNAALAIAGVRLLKKQGLALTDAQMASGLKAARWPGRLELFPGSPPILLDGAHNPGAVHVLADFLASPAMCRQTNQLIFSSLKDKNMAEMARILAPHVKNVWTVPVGGERASTNAALAMPWQALGKTVKPCQNSDSALNLARLACQHGDRILVAGSLYLVGEIRSLLL